MPLAVFRNLSWTMKYGLNSFSAPALGTAGIMFAGVLGDLQGGRKLAKSAIELSETQKGLTEGRTLFIVHGFVMHWTESLRDQLKPMLYAYDSALRSGDTETACWAIQNYCLMRFLTGTTLDILSKDTARYTAQMKDLAREKAYRLTIINLQLYINLMGESEEMAVLYGDVISQEEAEDWKKADKFYLSAHNFWECVILTIIGEYEKCAKLTAELGSDVYSKSAPGTFLSYYEAMSKGVSCFAVARQTRNKRYARTGYEVLRRVKGWIEKGNPNVVHIASLLEAEATAYAGKKFVALQKYELSILVAARSGLMLDAALASERFGDYNLEIKETNNAVFHYEAALKYYREAGAHGKANQILEKHSALWAHPSEVVLRSTSE